MRFLNKLYKQEIRVTSDERAFALIHGHLLNFTPFSAISGLGGVFFCPSEASPSRAISTPGQDIRPRPDQSCSGDLNGGVL